MTIADLHGGLVGTDGAAGGLDELAPRADRSPWTKRQASSTFAAMADSPLFAELAAALRERTAVIADRDLYARDPALHLEKLRAASERIASLQTQLPSPVDPHLAHYLDRCSYEKALAFLEGAH